MKSTLRALGLAALAGAATVSAGPLFAAPAHAAAAPSAHVIVTGTPGSSQLVAAAVRAAGGRVERTLGVVDGVVADVPAAAVSGLRTADGVRSVSLDASGHLQGLDPTLGYDVAGDEGSLYDIAQITHAKDAWSKGYTGKGVGVALIDSGVAPVKGLTSGNVVNGPDLSFESQNTSLVHLDTFGHGTHMASIIAGRDAVASGQTYAKADSHLYTGIAPDARLYSLKVAAADGGADVSQVIAAIDWVAQHASSLGIRVLNLSYGTDSTQDPRTDPLDYAVENAWKAGVVVVVSSGNDGTNRQTLADPANDPKVIAVGADDPNGTDSVGDDTVPDFAQRGTLLRHVDLIAPGVHVLGLRDPGSFVDQANPGAVVRSRFFRGSGTSQSAAVVSGLAALYLQKYPQATPDQVKRALVATATPPAYLKAILAGFGVPDINKALGVSVPTSLLSAQVASGATGTGTLEGARGSSHVTDGSADLTGEQDIFGKPFVSATWAAASSSGASWSGGTWNGTDWTSSSASSSGDWDAHSWRDADWAAHSWRDAGWSAHSWRDGGWDGASWSDSSWDASSWSASAWSGSAWSASAWSASSWS